MRATQAPEQWQEVLNAINQDDYKLANKLAVKYSFAGAINKEKIVDDVRHTPDKGNYVAMDPDGKMYCHEFGSTLSRYLGLSISYVASAIPRLEKHDGYSRAGGMKGWKFWQEK